MSKLIPFILFIIFWAKVDSIRVYIGDSWTSTIAIIFFIWIPLTFIKWLASQNAGSDNDW